MFKEERKFWWYILAICVLMVLTYFALASYRLPLVGFLLPGNEKSYEYDNPPNMQLDAKKDYRANIITNYGTIQIDLFEENAPITVNNFVFLSQAGFYDRVYFHRVVPDFIVQSGSRLTLDDDPDNDGLGDPGYFFDDEINWNSLGLSSKQIEDLQSAGFSNDLGITSRRLEKYSLAMANAGPDTNGSQFFFVTAETDDSRLDVLQGRHTVFGTVIGGADVLETINNARIEQADDDSISSPIGDYYIERVDIFTLEID